MDHRLKYIILNYKISRENTWENLCDLELNKDSLDMASKVRTMKENIDKLDLIKTENFCSSRDTVKRMKR